MGYNPSDWHGISRVNPLITGVVTHLRAVGWATKYPPEKWWSSSMGRILMDYPKNMKWKITNLWNHQVQFGRPSIDPCLLDLSFSAASCWAKHIVHNSPAYPAPRFEIRNMAASRGGIWLCWEWVQKTLKRMDVWATVSYLANNERVYSVSTQMSAASIIQSHR